MDNMTIYKAFRSANEIRSNVALIDDLNSLVIYLQKLCEIICPKGLKVKFIHQEIFKTELQKKELNNYYKANLFAAQTSLERIIAKIASKDAISAVCQRMIIDFICDLKPFIQHFDPSHDYSWLFANTNSHVSNFYSNLANSIFWNGSPSSNPEENLVLSSSTPFVIRQSIEYKIKRILGIELVLKKDGSTDLRANEKCFRALERTKHYYRTKDFEFEVIKKIYHWTHAYIHSGIRAEPWRTETALHYVNKLFYNGPTSSINSYSIYAGVEIHESDLSNFQEALEVFFEEEHKVIWLSKPEIAIIK